MTAGSAGDLPQADAARTRRRRLPLPSLGFMVGSAVGFLMAVLSFSPVFLAGRGAHWWRPKNDHVLYVATWRYFVGDRWRFPVFDVPRMGYPEGGNVIYADALPIGALASKVIATLHGPLLNPFGPWILLTYVLQGAMAARFVRACGVRHLWAAAAVSFLAVSAEPFYHRLAHIALSSHFLLLWALALYVECSRDDRPRVPEQAGLSALTLLVNPYLFAMVSALQFATIARFAVKGLVDGRLAAACGASAGLIAVLAWVSGYGGFLTGAISPRGTGFGVFSWNLPTLLVPPSLFGHRIPMVRDATGGQYEGDAYIGLGALLLLACALLTAPRRMVQAAREHWTLTVAVVALCLVAASDVVYAGSRWLIKVNLPVAVRDLAGGLRATGRFIWPLAYLLVLVPAVVLVRRWPSRAAALVLVAAVVLQGYEWRPAAARQRQWSATAYPEMIDTARFGRWMTAHERLFQFRSLSCGGMQSPPPQFGSPDSNRELQVQLLAARTGIPTNSFYTARMVKDCARELAWGRAPRFEPGVLYLLNAEVLPAATAAQAAGTLFCVPLGWGTACSTRPLL